MKCLTVWESLWIMHVLSQQSSHLRVRDQQPMQRANHIAKHNEMEINLRPFTVLAVRLCFLDEDNTFCTSSKTPRPATRVLHRQVRRASFF